LYVANTHGNNVLEFKKPLTSNSASVVNFGPDASTDKPLGLAIDSDDNLYAVNNGNNTVTVKSLTPSNVNKNAITYALNGPATNAPGAISTYAQGKVIIGSAPNGSPSSLDVYASPVISFSNNFFQDPHKPDLLELPSVT
jgi:hypothetical protein